MRTPLRFIPGRSYWFLMLLLLPQGNVLSGTFGLAVRINGQEITEERFGHYFDDYLSERGRNIAAIRNPDALRKLRHEALDALIDEELLWQEALHRGISAPAEEIDTALQRMQANFKTPEAFARRLERAGFTPSTYRAYLGQQLAVKHLVEDRIQADITISDREVHRFYKANPARFAIPEQRRLRLITRSAAEDARGRCDAILAQARQPRTNFATLAKQYSQDPSAERGGDLGYVSPGQLSAELDQAASPLKLGEISGVVVSATGCHILKLEQRRSGVLPEAEARETARAHLKDEKGRQTLRQYIEALRRRGKIEILMAM